MLAKTTSPVSPAQAKYLFALVMQAHASDPKARLKALESMAHLPNAAAASTMIDMLKASNKAVAAQTVNEKVEAAADAIKVTIPAKGVALLIDGAIYTVKKAKYGAKFYVYTGAGAADYLGTLGLGKTAAVEAVLADPAAYQASAYAYGQQTHHCCFCGIKLTDPASQEKGYGPVCEKKYILK